MSTPFPIRWSLLLLLALTFGLQACIIVVEEDDDHHDRRLHRHHWGLDVIVYHGRTYAPGETTYTLSFDENGRLNGQADCTTFSGRYALKSSGLLTVESLSNSRETCETSTLGDRFFEALEATDAYYFKDNDQTLVITAQDSDYALYFYRD